jgi:uncharacterized protein YbbC (DUF1343 family)
MSFRFFKSTFLFLVITATACGNNSGNPSVNSAEAKKDSPAEISKELKLGAERTAYYLPFLEGKKVGLVGNQTSIIPTEAGNVHLVDTLLALNVNLIKVFAPEHGFRGTADAGEVVEDGKDPNTGLPVISLYGDNKKPSAQQLEGLDVLIFDLQDVGVRFYTYISTLHYVMEAAAENDITVIIFDRPNPNGHYLDGPVLDPQYKSFVGMHPIPVVHGMTIGEYAKMTNGENWLKNGVQTDLKVIEMENYAHSMPYDLPVKPSPNLPNAKAINLYPSICFFEGTNVNAGRGTSKQFQVFGSPYLSQAEFPFTYVPEPNEGAKSPKHLNKTCYGRDLSNAAHLDYLNLEWLIEAYNHSAQKEDFFNAFFTKLAGTKELQKQIENGMTAEAIRETWKSGLEEFKTVRERYLLY